jgi:7,8-dihydropterin-6-yl-methyl-4-(beta-D-ribofuranosyl)aminobenzene 5'-phosphate synthase
MPDIILNAVDKVEIVTLQDNYIDLTVADNNNIITRATPVQSGEISASIFAEHGFSALVKTTSQGQTHTLLFDFGFSADGAAQNVQTLGLNLAEVEAVALSHGHSDHTGGVQKLATLINKKDTPFVVHPAAFKSPRYLKYSEQMKVNFPQLTRDMIQKAGFSLTETSAPYPLLDNTILFLGEIPRRTDFEKGFPIAHSQKDGKEVPDSIEDDTSLVINLRDKGLVIISGCAHSGIINTVRCAQEKTGIEKVHVVMGGFHLGGSLFEPIVGRTTEELQKINPDYIIPTHCTGRKSVAFIEASFPNRFILNMAGTKLTFA